MLFLSSRRRHARSALVTGVHTWALPIYHRERIGVERAEGLEEGGKGRRQIGDGGQAPGVASDPDPSLRAGHGRKHRINLAVERARHEISSGLFVSFRRHYEGTKPWG